MKYNVIIEDNGKFKDFDIIPYFIRHYKNAKHKPKTKKEFNKFIDDWAKYEFWARCEYEVILSDYPRQEVSEKIDVYQQIKINIDVITMIVMNELKKK